MTTAVADISDLHAPELHAPGIDSPGSASPGLDRARKEELPCWSEDPGLWFAESPAQVERAKSLCSSCPARVACLEGALTRRESCGVWGGELFLDGRVVAYKRGRGRPRKQAPITHLESEDARPGS